MPELTVEAIENYLGKPVNDPYGRRVGYIVSFYSDPDGRVTALEKLSNETRTIILYESVHRIIKTLKDLNEIFPKRVVSVHREMTKIHEEVIGGLISSVIDNLEKGTIKGEFVIIISGVRDEHVTTRQHENLQGVNMGPQW